MKIVVLGDSIAQGLGVAGCSYPELIGEWARVHRGSGSAVINLAYTAFQIADSAERLPVVLDAEPDVVVIAHGISEAIVRPIPAALRFAPTRWRQKGWMDPRPYFSRRKLKRWAQETESALRWRYKVLLMKKFGGYTWTSPLEFEQSMKGFIDCVRDATAARVILLTHCGIDDTFFPGSSHSLSCYQQVLSRLACQMSQSGRVYLCDVSQSLCRWEDFFADHFHPNARGHAKIADALCALLQKIGCPGEH